jgi:calcineurin-like phosphoesterase family protein
MSVLFTGDTHFGHGGALGLFRRPFPSVAAMDDAIVERWQQAVAAEDEGWHLGDFAVRQPVARMSSLLARLPGRKHLIIGNNDGEPTMGLDGWASTRHYVELEIEATLLVLCHYPLRSWNRMAQGALNLHGHSHGRLKPLPRQIDVGVDVWDFRPVALPEIRAHLRRRNRSPPPEERPA